MVSISSKNLQPFSLKRSRAKKNARRRKILRFLLNRHLQTTKVLNVKVLEFLVIVFRVSVKKIDLGLGFTSKKRQRIFYKFTKLCLEKIHVVSSILGYLTDTSFFKNETSRSRFYLFCKNYLYSFFFLKSFSDGLKNLHGRFISKYFLFFSFSLFNAFLGSTSFKETSKGSSLRTNFPSFRYFAKLPDRSLEEESSCFYEQLVFNRACFSESGPKRLPETEKELSAALLGKISGNFMRHKKKVLTDRQLWRVLHTVRSILFRKNLHNPKVLRVLEKSVTNVKPLYKVVQQRRGRNKVGVAKYLFIENVRQSLALKCLLGALKGLKIRKSGLPRLECKLVLILLDTLFERGSAVGLFKKFDDSAKTSNKSGVLNKSHLLRSTKHLLIK